LTVEDLKEILSDPSQSLQVYTQLRQIIKELGRNVFSNAFNQIGDQDWRKASQRVSELKPELFFTASEAEFYEDANFLWGEVDPFQQAFGRVFVTYRELIQRNTLLEKYPPEDNYSKRHLSPDEFEKEHGSPPWDFVNRILEECNLDFRIDHPALHETSSYEPKLSKMMTDVEMRFQDLSSGEKVLMSFALCLYNSEETRQRKVFPKLLLLDEVDAPLHPSMVKSLLKTIQNVLVRDKGVFVILTTHSPSTVALAPEESIYVMNPEGPRIESISRNSALSILTAGVPTLSVSFDGRRQVFVENESDARRYELLYQNLKSELNSERSLIFIGVGKKEKKGDENSGCSQVVKIVKSLCDGGNETVFGLIDWDTHNNPEKRISVLAHGHRYAIENCLLDPILLAAIVVRTNRLFGLEIGFLDQETFTMLKSMTHERLQNIVDAVQKRVLEIDDLTELQSSLVRYKGGAELKITQKYLQIKGHTLEEKIKLTFPCLKLFHRPGELLINIIDPVMIELPEFIPEDLVCAFKELLT
jgi:AAA domain, putative AbiEii toxin, Type IV TA system